MIVDGEFNPLIWSFFCHSMQKLRRFKSSTYAVKKNPKKSQKSERCSRILGSAMPRSIQNSTKLVTKHEKRREKKQQKVGFCE